MNNKNPYDSHIILFQDYQNYRSPSTAKLFQSGESPSLLARVNAYSQGNPYKKETQNRERNYKEELYDSPFKYHPKRQQAEIDYDEFQYRYKEQKLNNKLEVIKMEQKYVREKAEMLNNLKYIQKGNEIISKDINYNDMNDPYIQDEEEQRIKDRYEMNFKPKKDSALYSSQQFSQKQDFNKEYIFASPQNDRFLRNENKQDRPYQHNLFMASNLKHIQNVKESSIDRVQLLSYLKNGILQPSQLNDFFKFESDQIHQLSTQPSKQLNIEQVGRLKNYQSAINLAASSLLQDKFSYVPNKGNNLDEDKLYKPHTGFILKWDFITDLPLNIEKIKINYGFFQKGDPLFTYRSTSEQRNDLVYRSTTHHYLTTAEKNIRKCIVSENQPIKNIKLTLESVLYFDLWVWETNNPSFPSTYGWGIHQMLNDQAELNLGKFKQPVYGTEYNPYLIYETGIPYKSDTVYVCMQIEPPQDGQFIIKPNPTLLEQYIIPKLHLKKQNYDILKVFKSNQDAEKKKKKNIKKNINQDASDDIYADQDDHSLRKDKLHNGMYNPQDRPQFAALKPNKAPFSFDEGEELSNIDEIKELESELNKDRNNSKNKNGLNSFGDDIFGSMNSGQTNDQADKDNNNEQENNKQIQQGLNEQERQLVQEERKILNIENQYKNIYYNEKSQFTNVLQIKSNASNIITTPRYTLILEQQYFHSSLPSLHPSLEENQNLNILFVLNTIHNFEQVINPLLLRIRIFILFDQEIIYQTQDDVPFQISRSQNFFRIEYMKTLKINFNFENLLQNREDFNKLNLILNFSDTEDNSIGCAVGDLLKCKGNQFMLNSGNTKIRLKLFSKDLQQYQEQEQIVDYNLSLGNEETETLNIVQRQTSFEKKILTIQLEKLFNYPLKDESLLYQVKTFLLLKNLNFKNQYIQIIQKNIQMQLLQQDEDGDLIEMIYDGKNYSQIKKGLIAVDKIIDKSTFNLLAVEQIDMIKQEIYKISNFTKEIIVLKIDLYSQINQKKPIEIGSIQIPIIQINSKVDIQEENYQNNQFSITFIEGRIQQTEVKKKVPYKKQEQPIKIDFRINYIDQRNIDEKFYCRQKAYLIRINDIIDYIQDNSYLTFDISIQKNTNKIFDNDGSLCFFQYPNNINVSKKGPIPIKTNFIFSLNTDRLKEQLGNGTSQIILVISIYSVIDGNQSLYGWITHQIFKKDQSLNQGNFKLQMISPPIIESQLLETNKLPKLKTKLDFTIQSCRLDDGIFISKLPQLK